MLEGKVWRPALVVWHQYLEELLFHSLNPAGVVEAPRDESKRATNFTHTHDPFKTRTQDPQLMPSLMSAGFEVKHLHPRRMEEESLTQTESTVTLSLI